MLHSSEDIANLGIGVSLHTLLAGASVRGKKWWSGSSGILVWSRILDIKLAMSHAHSSTTPSEALATTIEVVITEMVCWLSAVVNDARDVDWVPVHTVYDLDRAGLVDNVVHDGRVLDGGLHLLLLHLHWLLLHLHWLLLHLHGLLLHLHGLLLHLHLLLIWIHSHWLLLH